jgi:hypothetical protein
MSVRGCKSYTNNTQSLHKHCVETRRKGVLDSAKSKSSGKEDDYGSG